MSRLSMISAVLLLFPANPARTEPPLPGLQNCVSGMSGEQKRRCDEEAFKQVESQSQTKQLGGGWRLVKTRDPRGGTDAASVMHVVDSAKSDINFAGLSLRCGREGFEVVLIVLERLSLATRPTVVMTVGSSRSEFEASVVQGGEALLLPRAASSLAAGEWQNATELSVEIKTKPRPIRGAVPIGGLSGALQSLNCAG